MRKSIYLLGFIILSVFVSGISFSDAYAVPEIVYYDYTSLVTSGAEPFGIECDATGFVYMTTFSGVSGGLLKIDKTNPASATFISQSTGADWYSVEYDN